MFFLSNDRRKKKKHRILKQIFLRLKFRKKKPPDSARLDFFFMPNSRCRFSEFVSLRYNNTIAGDRIFYSNMKIKPRAKKKIFRVPPFNFGIFFNRIRCFLFCPALTTTVCVIIFFLSFFPSQFRRTCGDGAFCLRSLNRDPGGDGVEIILNIDGPGARRFFVVLRLEEVSRHVPQSYPLFDIVFCDINFS